MRNSGFFVYIQNYYVPSLPLMGLYPFWAYTNWYQPTIREEEMKLFNYNFDIVSGQKRINEVNEKRTHHALKTIYRPFQV